MTNNSFWKRISNVGTITSIAGALVLIAQNLGLQFDVDVINTIVTSLCAIGIALGVLNNSTTQGLDNPFKSKDGD